MLNQIFENTYETYEEPSYGIGDNFDVALEIYSNQVHSPVPVID